MADKKLPDLAAPLPTSVPKIAPRSNAAIGLDTGPASTRMPEGRLLDVDDDDPAPKIALDYSLGDPAVRVSRPMHSRRGPEARVHRPRPTRWPWLLLLALIGGGAALERTEHGAFFRHSIDALVHADERALLTQDVIGKVHDALGADTLDRGNQALKAIDAAVLRAPRHKPLMAWAAYTVFAYELRFGRNPARHAQAVEWLGQAGTHSNAVLAAVAKAVVENDPARAREKLNNPESEGKMLLGYIELASKHPGEAVRALEDAVKLDASIRTRAALARAIEAVDTDRARELATTIASEAKSHIGARLILGRIAYGTKNSAALTQMVSELGPLEKDATQSEKSELFTLRGLHALERGEAVAARAAFEESSKLAISSSLNTLGLAHALIATGKPEEARAVLDSLTDVAYTADVAKLRALTGKPNKK